MAKNSEKEVKDYRHDTSKRKNNPPAGMAGQGRTPDTPKQEYTYNPHLPPILRSDPHGDADKLPELLQKALQEPLTPEEAKIIADALKHHEPWLEWAGKQEAKSFTVDPVALHVHERVSTKAILKVAERENVQRQLFADPQQTYNKAVEFYKHDVDWANRLILGDSLMVMSSLAHREDLAGKVQMIYIDPPYGIKFASNFQPTVFQRDVKNREQDLTREQEQIKAYRDTWTLGVHSYLAYLRDRLIAAKDLLADSGSIFVQISEENIHRVRCIMDEVFKNENFVGEIIFKTRSTSTSKNLSILNDYILWYGKDITELKFRRFYEKKNADLARFNFADIDGELFSANAKEKYNTKDVKYFSSSSLFSTSGGDTSRIPFEFPGKKYTPAPSRGWRCSSDGLIRLKSAGRIFNQGNSIRYKYFYSDFPFVEIGNLWNDQMSEQNKSYVVQTSIRPIERCLLMTTDPGDLILDPTCGSGTTAYVAESWGRRWITIDTSRVSIALARQRLLTASFDYYKLKDEANGVAGGFINKTVPHIMLKSIAQNTALDSIFEKHEPILNEKLEALNSALAEITPEIRAKLRAKLAEKERREGKRAITDADKRRWQLPETAWQAWEVPFDTDPDWTETLQEALTDYRVAWRAKMDEVNECIAAASEGEELVDQPEVDRKRIRVSGPFTVEAMQPPEEFLDVESPIGGEPDEMTDTFDTESEEHESVNAEAYLDKMIRLLRDDGVKFPEDVKQEFATLDPLEGGVLHGEGSWENGDADRRVAVAFGPQHGPVTVMQVEDCLPIASRLGYDELIFAGFSFDGAAQAIIQDDPNPRVHIHMAHISPDVVMDDLLKNTASSQLFTVFGLPRTMLVEKKDTDGNVEYAIEMEGVDIYNPVDNTVSSAGADKVAAWFVDSDYDGRTFCITQAFFPDKSAWNKIARDLKGVIDAESFEMFSGTESLPFPAGKYACVAVKVIDPRGNEVMRVHNLGD